MTIFILLSNSLMRSVIVFHRLGPLVRHVPEGRGEEGVACIREPPLRLRPPTLAKEDDADRLETDRG